jgi:hypothetical protein
VWISSVLSKLIVELSLGRGRPLKATLDDSASVISLSSSDSEVRLVLGWELATALKYIVIYREKMRLVAQRLGRVMISLGVVCTSIPC